MSICIKGHLTMQNDIIVTCSEVKHLFSSLRDTSSKYSNTKRDKNLQSIVVMKLSPAVGFIGDRSLRVGYNSTWDLSLHHIHNYILFSHVSLQSNTIFITIYSYDCIFITVTPRFDAKTSQMSQQFCNSPGYEARSQNM